MSEVKVNKISPRSGTDVTLGDASDTFTLPSSAEIDIASGATLDVNGTIDVTGSTVTGLSATDISSGTLGTARLGTGSASSSTFLRGDQSWAAAGGDNTPAFMAVSSAAQSIAHNTWVTIACPTEIYDSDSAYDTSTYKFTVPAGEQGVYVFSHTNGIGGMTSSAELVFGFGSDNAAAFGKSSGATSEGFGSGAVYRVVTAVANLDAGDEVWATVVQSTGSTQSTSNVAAFSGFKLIGSPF